MGKKPKCEYCDDDAMLDTPVANIYICYKDKCKVAFCDDQCGDIEEDDF